MDKRLSKYLQGVEAQLGSLSEAQRDSELREMRQHLDAIIARLVEGGLSYEEAAEAATAQFGPPQQVGRELRGAHEEHEPLWRIALAPLCGAACGAALSSFLPQVDEAAIKLSGSMLQGWWQYMAWSFLLSWPITVAAGAVAGVLSPRWGSRLMAALATTVFLAAIPLGLVPVGSLLTPSFLGVGVGVMLLNVFSGLWLGSLGAKWATGRHSQLSANALKS